MHRRIYASPRLGTGQLLLHLVNTISGKLPGTFTVRNYSERADSVSLQLCAILRLELTTPVVKGVDRVFCEICKPASWTGIFLCG
jgi:hypothetical protein